MENYEIQGENKTAKIVKNILTMFVIFVVLAYASYYVYDNFFSHKSDVNENELIKALNGKDISKHLNGLNEEGGISYTNQSETDKKDCYVGKKVLKDGQKIKMYSKRIVNPYDDCENYAQERKCDDGHLTGENTFSFLKCEKKLDCVLPSGNILKNGNNIKLYSRKYVPYGETCERYAQIRHCRENVLTGSDEFIYEECHISYDNSCKLENGKYLANNQSHTFYDTQTVPFGESCSKHAKRLICVNANIQGGDITKYKYWNCQQEPPKDCYTNGGKTKVPHGITRKLYSKEYGTKNHNCDWYSEIRTCYNGELDGQPEYIYEECYDE